MHQALAQVASLFLANLSGMSFTLACASHTGDSWLNVVNPPRGGPTHDHMHLLHVNSHKHCNPTSVDPRVVVTHMLHIADAVEMTIEGSSQGVTAKSSQKLKATLCPVYDCCLCPVRIGGASNPS